MIAETFERAVRSQTTAGDGSVLSLPRLCEICADVTSFRTTIVLITGGYAQAAMGASEGAAAVEDLQFTLGEGPGVDAYRDGLPVLVPDLAEAAARWSQFVAGALALGVRAALAYPLHVGVISVGVLSLYAAHPLFGDEEHLSGEGHLRELANLAGSVTGIVLASQSGAEPEELAWSLAGAADYRAVVHQAAGMLSVQVNCTVQEALVRLRARAFAEGADINDMARQIVLHQMRFDR